MTKEMSYYELANIVKGMDQIMEHNPALALLLGSKIEHFRKNNALRINNISKRVNDIINTYVKKDENGNLITEKDENGKEVYVFERDLERQKYERDLNAFFSISFQVTL